MKMQDIVQPKFHTSIKMGLASIIILGWQGRDLVWMIFIYRRKLGKLRGVYKGFMYKIWW